MERLSLATRSTSLLDGALRIAPEVDRHLAAVGVPEVLFGGRFRLDPAIRVVKRPDGSPLLRLGVVMESTALCVDPRTGGLVEIWTDDGSTAQRSGDLPWRETFVNSSLARFVETAVAVVERLPYYDRESPMDARHRVALELAGMIESIDPPAMATDLFWSSFVDDVEIGDFATEDLV